MITLLVCPYGHEAEATMIEAYNLVKQHADASGSIMGVACGECHRVFIAEAQPGSEFYTERDPGGPPIGRYPTQYWIYELRGPWAGTELTFKSVDNGANNGKT